MKIVRTFKNDPHPSIVPFHSFIITPSYALITMDYFPELVPVEVPETKAKDWFRSLLSGVAFLHKRGIVHNDIKCAHFYYFVTARLALQSLTYCFASFLVQAREYPALSRPGSRAR
jgi:serine/threonine protein kinase